MTSADDLVTAITTLLDTSQGIDYQDLTQRNQALQLATRQVVVALRQWLEDNAYIEPDWEGC